LAYVVNCIFINFTYYYKCTCVAWCRERYAGKTVHTIIHIRIYGKTVHTVLHICIYGKTVHTIFTYTYSFLILCIELYFAHMQTKLYQSCPRHAKGLGCLISSMDWFHLTQSRDRWQSLVNLVKWREFLNQLRNYKLFRKDSALWSLSFHWVIQTNDDLKLVLLLWIYETDSLHIQIIFLLGKFLSMGEMKGAGNGRCYITSFWCTVKLPFEVALENSEIEYWTEEI